MEKQTEEKKRRFVLPVKNALLIIILMTCAFHLPIFKCHFAADDWYQIEKRTPEQVLSTFYGDWHIGSQGTGGFYRPLIRLTFFIEQNLYGINPAGYHLTNLFFHLLTVSIFFFILLKISDSIFITWFATTIYALFPTHIEPIYWVSGRTDVIAACFLFTAVLSWVNYLSNKEKHNVENQPAAGKLSSLFHSPAFNLSLAYTGFILGLLSKEMALTFLFIAPVFILHKFIITKKIDKAAIANLVIFAVIGVIYFILRKKFLGGIGGYSIKGELFTLNTMRLTYKTFLFSMLNPFTGTIPNIKPMLVFAIIFALYTSALFILRFPFILLFGGYWLFVTILPMISLTVSPLSGGRLLYIPSAGYCIIIAVLIDMLFIRHIPFQKSSASIENKKPDFTLRLIKDIGYFLVGVCFAVCLFLSKVRQNDWVGSARVVNRSIDGIKKILNHDYLPRYEKDLKNAPMIVLLNPRENVRSALLFHGWSMMQAAHVFMDNKEIPIQIGFREYDNPDAFYIYIEHSGNPQRLIFRKKEVSSWSGDEIRKWEYINAITASGENGGVKIIAGREFGGMKSPDIFPSARGLGFFMMNIRVDKTAGFTGSLKRISSENEHRGEVLQEYILYNTKREEFDIQRIDTGPCMKNFCMLIYPAYPIKEYEVTQLQFTNYIFENLDQVNLTLDY